MHGPAILATFLSTTNVTDRHGNEWQYNPWSDHHSKAACWGLFFDLLLQSAALRAHVQSGKVVFGVNYLMRDYATGRKKKLDLVIARPASAPATGRSRSLVDLGDQWGIPLTKAQREDLTALPVPEEGPVGAVLMALEAKACMTAHQKSLPRFYDELNSSHLTVHGASSQALAVGLAVVNASERFISPKMNNRPLGSGPPSVVSVHRQPYCAAITLQKVSEIPRRSGNSGNGFDAIGCVVIDCANDGTPVRLVTTPPAPQPGDTFHYETAVTRIGNEYDTIFKSI